MCDGDMTTILNKLKNLHERFSLMQSELETTHTLPVRFSQCGRNPITENGGLLRNGVLGGIGVREGNEASRENMVTGGNGPGWGKNPTIGENECQPGAASFRVYSRTPRC